MLEDFDFLIKTLEEVHPNLYAYVDEAETRARYLEIKESFVEDMTVIDFYRKVGKLIAGFKDGHTHAYLSAPLIDMKNFKYLPPDIAFIEGKAIVTHDNSHTFKKNDQILAINDINMEEIYEKILTYISGEKDTFRNVLAGFWLNFLLYIVYGFESPFKIKYKSGEEVSEVMVEGLTNSDLKELAKNAPESNKTNKETFKIEDGIGILTIPSFAHYNEDEQTFCNFIDSSFLEMREHKPSKLIIDVRDNGGGTSQMAKYLIHFLTAKPIKVFDRYLWKNSQQVQTVQLGNVKKNPGNNSYQEAYDYFQSVPLGECFEINCETETSQRPADLIFKGDLIVLSDGMCFSTTTSFLAIIRDYQLGKIVGTVPGGIPNCYGDIHGFTLPHTNIGFAVSQKYFIRPLGNESDNDLTPDYLVEQTAEDRAKSVDTVLEFAKRL